MTLWHSKVCKLASFCIYGEIQCKKIAVLCYKAAMFKWDHLESGKYARITIEHVCFIALTLIWSLGDISALMFKNISQDQANVYA